MKSRNPGNSVVSISQIEADLGVKLAFGRSNPKLGQQRRLDVFRKAIHWIKKVDDPNVKEMLFRLLADKDAREQAFSFLIEQFEEVGDAQRGNLRWVVGLAIGQMSHVVDLPVLHRLAEKTEYGSGRQEIVVGIGKLGNDTSIDVLTGLVDDPSVALHAATALRQLSRRLPRAAEVMTTLRNHSDPRVRKVAIRQQAQA